MGQGINAASRQAAQRANLDALDSLGSDRSGFSTILNPIEESAGAFIERVVKNIEAEKMVVTGAIEGLSITADDSSVQIRGPLHLIFQDKGVNGSIEKPYNTPFSYKDKMPPWQIFVNWIKARNIQLRNEDKYTRKPNANGSFASLDGDDKDIENAARAIAYVVWKRGFKPRFVYSKEIPKLLEDLQSKIPGFAASQIAETFNNLPPQNVNVIL